MSPPREVTVTGPVYWSAHVDQLVALLSTSTAAAIRDPSGATPTSDDVLVVTDPEEWALMRGELRDALLFAAGESAAI